jgi:hypothetical protein
MAWFLFVDESGQDHRDSPYEVLAGVAIRDSAIWPFIQELHEAELRNFGRRYSGGGRELKGTKILKRKTFAHAALNCTVSLAEIPALAKEFMDDGGANNTIRHFKALGLAKLNYVQEVFALCAKYDCRIFGSIVEIDAHPTSSNGLRKDYAYLFQRFFYFLDDIHNDDQGVVVFDELEKTKSHILIEQTHRYFKETVTGRTRSRLIVPEPFFVHSDLTTGIQVADLVAYCLS